MGLKRFSESEIENIVSEVGVDKLHHMQIKSLTNAVLGILTSGSLLIHHIGRGLAQHNGKSDKHSIKQVDRLLSNRKISQRAMQCSYVRYVIGGRKTLMVILDWTSFYDDGHKTLSLSLVTNHGRSTALMWVSVKDAALKNKQRAIEVALLKRFYTIISPHIKVRVLADRGFCSIELMKQLDSMGFEYVLRIRQNLYVCDEYDEGRDANQWLIKYRRYPRLIRNAKITNQLYDVASLAFTKDTKSGDAWLIVSNIDGISAKALLDYYRQRWACEPAFRDTKDIRYGMGLDSTHIKSTKRRDMLLLLSALATLFLTVAGAACEAIGYTKKLQANTVKEYRVISLVRQGFAFLQRLPNLTAKLARQFKKAFQSILLETLIAQESSAVF